MTGALSRAGRARWAATPCRTACSRPCGKSAPPIATVQGSGRTDAGVGALGQVAHFDAPASASLDGAAWVRALNAKLPATIRVFDCRETDPAFHARFDATGKTYRYTLWTGPSLSNAKPESPAPSVAAPTTTRPPANSRHWVDPEPAG